MSNAEWKDGDGYPTEAALKRIETWPSEDIAGCLDFVKALWHFDGWGVSETLRPEEATILHAEPDERYLRLATGGWSGNESLIDALNANTMVRVMTWKLHARGGLHIYQYPQQEPRC